jgi:hypothetical protein
VKPVPPAALASSVAGQQIEFDRSGQTVLPVSGEVFSAVGEQMQVPGYSSIPATESMALHKKIEKRLQQRSASGGSIAPQSNEPAILASNGAFSAAVFTTIGGRDTQFDDVEALANWDGRDDFVADRQGTVDDFSGKIPPPGGDWSLTRVAVSAHTIANGYLENIFYYGDSFGNVYVAQTDALGLTGTPLPPGGLPGDDGTGTQPQSLFSMNLPTLLNAFGSISSDDQITITGLAVSPVCDLTSFANVNGAFANFAGQIGEILYVSFWDTGSGFRLTSNNIIVRSGVLAFAVSDVLSPATTPPAVQSPANFPVTVGGAFGVAFSVFGNLAGSRLMMTGTCISRRWI